MKCFSCGGEVSLKIDGKKITGELGKYPPSDVQVFLGRLRKLLCALSPVATLCFNYFIEKVIGKSG